MMTDLTTVTEQPKFAHATDWTDLLHPTKTTTAGRAGAVVITAAVVVDAGAGPGVAWDGIFGRVKLREKHTGLREFEIRCKHQVADFSRLVMATACKIHNTETLDPIR